ncbi:MAG: cupin [Acetobacteraceae bacterium]|nr:cupin [Acetobacteraceae bacterium]
MAEPESLSFADADGVPNSPLPLLLYREALPPDAAAMEACFRDNGWSNGWRNGIFRYHHFHSIAHEVLGIAAGVVDVAFGGRGGVSVRLSAGDVVVIPAGVGHCNEGQTADLLIVGAYPGGGHYDLCRDDPSQRKRVLANIAAVPVPQTDPVHGAKGALRRLWAGRG